MTPNGWLQIALFFLIVLALAKPMGSYLTAVFERRRTWLDPVLNPVEKLLYSITRVKPAEEMRWTEYLLSMLVFSAALQPAASAGGRARSRVEHGHVVYDQHQLAVLHARNHDELLHPDVRARHP
jgi:hypothetical protein